MALCKLQSTSHFALCNHWHIKSGCRELINPVARRNPTRPARQSEDRVRDIAIAAYSQARSGQGYASDVLTAAFRDDLTLGPRGRNLAARRAFQMIHLDRTIDFALELAGVFGRRRHSGMTRYVACRVLERELNAQQATMLLPGIDWSLVAAARNTLTNERDAVRKLALEYSLPDFLAARLLDEFGTEAGELARTLGASPPVTVRVNTLKASRASVVASLEKSGHAVRAASLAPQAVTLQTESPYGEAASALRELRSSGSVEPQDEGSQLIAALVAVPKNGGVVVDLCAGAGGKTLALGALMNNRGQLWTLSFHAHDAEQLRRRAVRAGLSNLHPLIAQVTETSQSAPADPQAFWPKQLRNLAGKADRVLVDAPCSGLGALRRKPEARWRLTEDSLSQLTREQFAILNAASALCARDGYLIYATCTFLKGENEEVIERFLKAQPDFAAISAADVLTPLINPGIVKAVCDASGMYLKLLPHRHGTDGFFAAVMQKR